MLQELFRIPGLDIPIYGYGVMLVIAFLLSLELAKYLARRAGLDPEVFVNAGLIALVAGVVGARLSHVIENWAQYTDASRSAWENFRDAINIRSGGLTFYGGFLLAFPVTVAYGLIKKIPIRLGMDIVAPCVMVGLGVGRIGCFLNGCCYGAECSSSFPLGVTFPGHAHPVHPAQLYSTFTALLIAGICVCYFSLRPSPGRVMALMMMLEGTTRFLLELLRAEPPVANLFGFGWSLSMLLGAAILVAGAALWFAFGERSPAAGLSPSPGRL